MRQLPNIDIVVGEDNKWQKVWGDVDAGASVYLRIQNQLLLTVTVQGGEFAIVLNNVFTFTGLLLGLDFPVLDAEAGFQVAAAFPIDLSGIAKVCHPPPRGDCVSLASVSVSVFVSVSVTVSMSVSVSVSVSVSISVFVSVSMFGSVTVSGSVTVFVFVPCPCPDP